jgi:hypothetical protein
MTTRQRIARQQLHSELRALLKNILSGIILGAGFVVIFFLS